MESMFTKRLFLRCGEGVAVIAQFNDELMNESYDQPTSETVRTSFTSHLFHPQSNHFSSSDLECGLPRDVAELSPATCGSCQAGLTVQPTHKARHHEPQNHRT